LLRTPGPHCPRPDSLHRRFQLFITILQRGMHPPRVANIAHPSGRLVFFILPAGYCYGTQDPALPLFHNSFVLDLFSFSHATDVALPFFSSKKFFSFVPVFLSLPIACHFFPRPQDGLSHRLLLFGLCILAVQNQPQFENLFFPPPSLVRFEASTQELIPLHFSLAG